MTRVVIWFTVGILVIALLAFFSLDYLVSKKGPQIFTSRLERLFGRRVQIGSITMELPLKLVVLDLKVNDLFYCKKLSAGLGVIGLLRQNIVLSELNLEGLDFVIERKKQQNNLENSALNQNIETQVKSPPASTDVSSGESVSTKEKNLKVREEFYRESQTQSQVTPKIQEQNQLMNLTGSQTQQQAQIQIQNKTNFLLPEDNQNNQKLTLTSSEFFSQGSQAVSSEQVPLSLFRKRIQGLNLSNLSNIPINSLYIKKIILTEGQIRFVDHKISEQPLELNLKEINAVIENFRWPVTADTVNFFKIRANIPSAQLDEKGVLVIDGWVNFYRRNINANVRIKNLDAIKLSPYFSPWVDIEKARIQKARFNFTSNITGVNNEVTAFCRLELTQLEFKPRQKDEQKDRLERLTEKVIGMLRQQNQEAIVLDFTYRTKFDSPEFGIQVIRNALVERLSQAAPRPSPVGKVIRLPASAIKDTFSTAADLTKSLINTTVGIGQELTGALKASFRREQKETSPAIKQGEKQEITSSNTSN
ncbi:MAG: DUF748 domain-containing protein [Candidatus Omnitrophica bacterium]|nr:DUF748 domain-containing protein [Candidatus Omnitrophota bacterium]